MIENLNFVSGFFGSASAWIGIGIGSVLGVVTVWGVTTYRDIRASIDAYEDDPDGTEFEPEINSFEEELLTHDIRSARERGEGAATISLNLGVPIGRVLVVIDDGSDTEAYRFPAVQPAH